jgi:hypothetical protein
MLNLSLGAGTMIEGQTPNRVELLNLLPLDTKMCAYLVKIMSTCQVLSRFTKLIGGEIWL